MSEANTLGLYDMHGNVWEWCEDRYDTAATGSRVLRGGSWTLNSDYCRAGFRFLNTPAGRLHTVGLRVVVCSR